MLAEWYWLSEKNHTFSFPASKFLLHVFSHLCFYFLFLYIFMKFFIQYILLCPSHFPTFISTLPQVLCLYSVCVCVYVKKQQNTIKENQTVNIKRKISNQTKKYKHRIRVHLVQLCLSMWPVWGTDDTVICDFIIWGKMRTLFPMLVLHCLFWKWPI